MLVQGLLTAVSEMALICNSNRSALGQHEVTKSLKHSRVLGGRWLAYGRTREERALHRARLIASWSRIASTAKLNTFEPGETTILVHCSLRLHPIDNLLPTDLALPHPLQTVCDRLQASFPELDGKRLDDTVQDELGDLLQSLDVVLEVLLEAGDNHESLPLELAAEGRVEEAR